MLHLNNNYVAVILRAVTKKQRCKRVATKINNVLLVEDDELTRNLLKAYLEKESFVVSSASDGQEMIALLDRDSFDLVT